MMVARKACMRRRSGAAAGTRVAPAEEAAAGVPVLLVERRLPRAREREVDRADESGGGLLPRGGRKGALGGELGAIEVDVHRELADDAAVAEVGGHRGVLRPRLALQRRRERRVQARGALQLLLPQLFVVLEGEPRRDVRVGERREDPVASLMALLFERLRGHLVELDDEVLHAHRDEFAFGVPRIVRHEVLEVLQDDLFLKDAPLEHVLPQDVDVVVAERVEAPLVLLFVELEHARHVALFEQGHPAEADGNVHADQALADRALAGGVALLHQAAVDVGLVDERGAVDDVFDARHRPFVDRQLLLLLRDEVIGEAPVVVAAADSDGLRVDLDQVPVGAVEPLAGDEDRSLQPLVAWLNLVVHGLVADRPDGAGGPGDAAVRVALLIAVVREGVAELLRPLGVADDVHVDVVDGVGDALVDSRRRLVIGARERLRGDGGGGAAGRPGGLRVGGEEVAPLRRVLRVLIADRGRRERLRRRRFRGGSGTHTVARRDVTVVVIAGGFGGGVRLAGGGVVDEARLGAAEDAVAVVQLAQHRLQPLSLGTFDHRGRLVLRVRRVRREEFVDAGFDGGVVRVRGGAAGRAVVVDAVGGAQQRLGLAAAAARHSGTQQ
mmetsp:Transcript_23916/g.74102  ORF Transcript_23916/g.74102 Transcript_23916/m.74102 type:complete len:611 (-) Transcript_23916:22-1854(-)